MLVEVCANSLESALVAQEAGADRIELCAALGVGGITPSAGTIALVQEALHIPVHVLIRPRSGNFTYTMHELESMKANIAFCKNSGVAGVVCGVLTPNFTVDLEQLKILRKAAKDMHFTFHRAFDWVENPVAAIAQLEPLGIDSLLSSGQQKKAVDGITLLEELQNTVNTCTVMPGGGIHKDNALRFKKAGFKALHLSGTALQCPIGVDHKVPMHSSAFLAPGYTAVTQLEKVRQVVESVK